jgi:imidazole glycerol phosphate synthase subunit HisF
MIVPCIDLMGGKVVQLVQGRDKALEGGTIDEMLARFAGFPVIQVIDLDAEAARTNHSCVVFAPKPSAASAAASVRRSAPESSSTAALRV